MAQNLFLGARFLFLLLLQTDFCRPNTDGRQDSDVFAHPVIFAAGLLLLLLLLLALLRCQLMTAVDYVRGMRHRPLEAPKQQQNHTMQHNAARRCSKRTDARCLVLSRQKFE
jgi:hypothetical protein